MTFDPYELEDREAAMVEACLRKLGIELRDVNDLINVNFDYRAAMPSLLELLPRLVTEGVREAVVRGLSIRSTPPEGIPVLLAELYRARQGSSLQWACGNALDGAYSGQGYLDELISAATDLGLRSGRDGVTYALGRSKDPRVNELMPRLLVDPDPAVVAAALRIVERRRLGANYDAVAEIAASHIEPEIRRLATRVRGKFDDLTTKGTGGRA